MAEKAHTKKPPLKSTIRCLLEDRRLFMLMAALVLVVYAMIETGKPKTWDWMFPSGTSTPKAVLPAPQTPSDPAHDDAKNQSSSAFDRSQPDWQTDHRTPSNPNRLIASLNQPPGEDEKALPEVLNQFWTDQFRRLNPEKQASLFLLLYHMRHQRPRNPTSFTAIQRQSWISLIEEFREQRDRLHRSILSELSFTNESSERKKTLANDLFESEQFWEMKLNPAFDNFIDSLVQPLDQSIPVVTAVEQIQRLLDRLVFAQVQDRTGLGLSSDKLAWKRIWELATTEKDPNQAPIPVTHLELSSQPEFYRGRAIQINGIVQAARVDPYTVMEMEIDRMYALLIKPNHSNISPIFVYCLQLPNDFPELSDNYTTMHYPIQANGHFFKLRSYTDTAREIQNAPVVLASSVAIVSNFHEVDQEAPQTEAFVQIVATALLGLSMLAVIGAWVMFRFSDRNQYRPAADLPDEIRENLSELRNNSDVKTEQERIKELYDR